MMRIQYGPGYRIYFITRDAELIVLLLLCGGPATRHRAGQENGDGIEELMSEEYREFDATNYIRNEEDVRGASQRSHG